jgi:hypothetical protein
MPRSGVRLPAVVVRTLQTIVAALTVGCVGFLAIVLFMVGGPADSPDLPLLTYAACGVAASMVLARIIVPGIIVAQARRKIRDDAGTSATGKTPAVSVDPTEPDPNAVKLVQVFMTRTIAAAAILEGAVFLLLLAYLFERSPVSLVFVIVLIVALVAHIPTRSRAEGWVEEQMRLLDEERAF